MTDTDTIRDIINPSLHVNLPPDPISDFELLCQADVNVQVAVVLILAVFAGLGALGVDLLIESFRKEART